MKYQTYDPHIDLASIVQCYWSLEVGSDAKTEKQRIIPDGSIEMAFILADDVKRFTSEDEFIIQPRSMVLGQTIEPFYIQPTGEVNTFAIRFYPYGFANLIDMDIKELLNKETHINKLFNEEDSSILEMAIIEALDTAERIKIIEQFLLTRLQESKTIDKIVSSTVNEIISSNGAISLSELFEKNQTSRRQLERKFSKQVGLSPKQLGKVIRLQAALKLLINNSAENLTQIAYKTDYYDQAHFIKDFKEFTGTNPKNYLNSTNLKLSTLFYSKS